MHWTFDAIDGSEVPSTSAAPPLTILPTIGKKDALSGDLLPEFVPKVADGKVGQSIEFDRGQQGGLVLSNFDAFGFSEKISISFWMNVGEPVPLQVLVSTMDGPRDPKAPVQSAGWIVYLRDGSIHFDVVDGRSKLSRTSTPSGSIVQDEWNHVCVTAGDSAIKIFVNGELMADRQVDGAAMLPTNARLVVGNYNLIAQFRHKDCPAFGGRLDDLKIFDTVLTNDAVGALYSPLK